MYMNETYSRSGMGKQAINTHKSTYIMPYIFVVFQKTENHLESLLRWLPSKGKGFKVENVLGYIRETR